MNETHSTGGQPEDPVLRHAETEQELRACFPVMRELRPQLANEQDLLERVQRMRGQGYRLLAAWHGGQALALAGYRPQENLVYGRFLYVDDLVVAQADRGKRLGARLLQHLRTVAHDAGCRELVLDTALSNALGQRFYFRQGLLTRAIRFSVPVTEPD
jgi:ribosomal protein S18 acetylase RimI-like enzyme